MQRDGIPNAKHPVHRPAHYTHGEVECIDAMVSAFGPAAVRQWARLNAFKYIWRANEKHASDEEDVRKAIWYLRWSIGEDPRL